MKKPPIPDVPKTQDQPRARFDQAVKENLELLTGRRAGTIGRLPANADLGAVVAKINEIIDRLH